MGLDIWFKADLANLLRCVKLAQIAALDVSDVETSRARAYRQGIEDTIAALWVALDLPPEMPIPSATQPDGRR